MKKKIKSKYPDEIKQRGAMKEHQPERDTHEKLF